MCPLFHCDMTRWHTCTLWHGPPLTAPSLPLLPPCPCPALVPQLPLPLPLLSAPYLPLPLPLLHSCFQVGMETFRLCRELLDGIILVDNSAISSAIKDVFNETRCILEPAGAVSRGVWGVRMHFRVSGSGVLRCGCQTLVFGAVAVAVACLVSPCPGGCGCSIPDIPYLWSHNCGSLLSSHTHHDVVPAQVRTPLLGGCGCSPPASRLLPPPPGGRGGCHGMSAVQQAHGCSTPDACLMHPNSLQVGVAGAKAWLRYHKHKGKTVVAVASGANINFERLRLVAELANVGSLTEATMATTIPERPGAFLEFIAAAVKVGGRCGGVAFVCDFIAAAVKVGGGGGGICVCVCTHACVRASARLCLCFSGGGEVLCVGVKLRCVLQHATCQGKASAQLAPPHAHARTTGAPPPLPSSLPPCPAG